MEEKQAPSIENNFGFKEEIQYAGFWIRVAASLIDLLIMIPILVLGYFNQINLKSIVILYVLTILSALYKPLLEWRYGATLGKMACKIKVVNEKLKPISIDQAFGRYIPWAISAILQLMVATNIFLSPKFTSAHTYMEIGILTQESPLNNVSSIYSLIFLLIVSWVIFDPRKQGVHDKIAKTFCIKVTN